jgi:hypothetical protein
MKDMQGRMWREGDLMRQRMGISLASELDEPNMAESKLESASRLMSGLSISGAKEPSSSTGIASSAKPVLNSRSHVATSGSSSPDDDGQVTQGDLLRQRRTHGHHLTPAEAKSSSASVSSSAKASQSKSLLSLSSKPSAASAAPSASTATRPTTRSQISKLFGK